MKDAYHAAGCAVEFLRPASASKAEWQSLGRAVGRRRSSDLRRVDAYARVYSVDCAALAYPATSAARCLSRDLIVNDSGAITLSICQLALLEDGGGELDRFLASLIAQKRALAAPPSSPAAAVPASPA